MTDQRAPEHEGDKAKMTTGENDTAADDQLTNDHVDDAAAEPQGSQPADAVDSLQSTETAPGDQTSEVTASMPETEAQGIPKDASMIGESGSPNTVESVPSPSATVEATPPASEAPAETADATAETRQPTADKEAPEQTETASGEAARQPVEVAREIPFGFVDTEGRIHQQTTEKYKGRIVGIVIGSGDLQVEELQGNFRPLEKEVEVLENEVSTAKNKVAVMGRVRRMTSTVNKAEALGDFDQLLARLMTLRTEIQTEIAERRAAKEVIIVKAETLTDSTEWKATGDAYKALFQEWKQIGATGRDADDKLWARFIAPRENFNQRRSKHFDEMREKWDENKIKKQDLIVRTHELSTSDEWRDTSRAMRDLFDEWKTVGSAGRQSDEELWQQFRGAQQHFYDRRKLVYDDNKVRKEHLCERSERLANSTEWDDTIEEMKSMMAEWKTIGTAGKRDLDDKLWNRFRSAQNAFFDRRYAEASAREQQARDAAKSKEDIVIAVEGLAYSSDAVAAGEQAAELHAQFGALPALRQDREEVLGRRLRKALADIRVNAAAEGARRSSSWEGKLRDALDRSKEQLDSLTATAEREEAELTALQAQLTNASDEERTEIEAAASRLSDSLSENRAEIERLRGSIQEIQSSFD